MSINKVEINGETKLDLTQDTVTPDTLLPGVSAHNAAGERIVGEAAAVRYDTAQPLTSDQKVQARTNINAAGNFKSVQIIGDQPYDPNLSKIGWYRIFSFDNSNGSALVHIRNSWSNAPPTDLLMYVVSDPYKPLVAILASSRNTSGSVDNARLMKSADGKKFYFDIHYCKNGNNSVGCDLILSSGLSYNAPAVTWQGYTAVDDAPEGETLLAPAEWADPPMDVGVEYRTTERYQGKSVCVKAVNFGALPNSSEKHVGYLDGNDRGFVISISGNAKSSSNNFHIPSSLINVVKAYANSTDVFLKTEADLSNCTATVIVKYIKSTD